jgi:hypothetical protein
MSAQNTIRNLRETVKELRKEGNEWVNKIFCRKKIAMWTYPQDKLNQAWHLKDLQERTYAAQALGYSVGIEATAKGIEVFYFEKLPTYRPWNF